MLVDCSQSPQPPTGYLHPSYAHSLDEFGSPVELPASGGRILRRSIPGTDDYDGMGLYPVFCCQDWSNLARDITGLGTELVSLVLVTDPFGDFLLDDLQRAFGDLVTPFKQHYVADLARSPDAFVSPHHRRYARKSLRRVRVELSLDPRCWLDDWTSLYASLVQRRGIQRRPGFTRASFQQQLAVPGIVALRALEEERPVAMLFWYRQGQIGYYHLGASNERGYELWAAFSLFWSSLLFLPELGVRWLALGAAPGGPTCAEDGLNRFKRGWSSGSRPVYLCGRILDSARYAALTGKGGTSRYFPAYRRDEIPARVPGCGPPE